MKNLKIVYVFMVFSCMIISCRSEINVDKDLEELSSLKNSLEGDSIFQKSPLKDLAMQTDIVHSHYLKILDTLKNLKSASIINDYMFKFLDIDSIINDKIDTIDLINNSDSREIMKRKIITNEITILNRIKYYYKNQDAIYSIKIIRVCPTIEKGQLKNIIVFVPDSNQIVCLDSGYFYGYGKFLQFKTKAIDFINDSISFKSHNKFSDIVYTSKFEIY